MHAHRPGPRPPRTLSRGRAAPAADRGRFLPVSAEDLRARGWDAVDVLLITGDAYADHPAFGVPLLGRILEAEGFRVGIVAQPRWDTLDDIRRLGAPRLFCGVSAGSLDSMLAHYTAFRKKRSEDAYTPGGRTGRRPNRACIVYSNMVRRAFPGTPIVLGGIEASLRRAAHYDFWTDSIRRSILVDARADLVLYGMAEQSIVEVARRLRRGDALAGVPGAAFMGDPPEGAQQLPSWEDIRERPRALLEATLALERQVQRGGPVLAQGHGGRFVIFTPPPEPSPGELDRIADLPFTREAHPDCDGPIPALEMVRWSITAVRGCGGGCSFCSLALHQGRRIRSRSPESILREVRSMTAHPAWRGSVADVGGPTANFWGSECGADPSRCNRSSCLWPARCPRLRPRQRAYLELLRAVRAEPGVNHVAVASGIRHDLALEDPEFVAGLVAEFVGGHLKLAPEHCAEHVLDLMRKCRFDRFEEFLERFGRLSAQKGREQYVVPYVMSAFPGCTLSDMKRLADWFRRRGWRLRQVQCFVPTPGTMATALFYAGCDPDGRPIHVARTDREREDQHRILTGGRLRKRPGTGRQRPPPDAQPDDENHPA